MEITPYGIKQENGQFTVWQMWHGKQVAGPFRTRKEAEREAERIKRERG